MESFNDPREPLLKVWGWKKAFPAPTPQVFLVKHHLILYLPLTTYCTRVYSGFHSFCSVLRKRFCPECSNTFLFIPKGITWPATKLLHPLPTHQALFASKEKILDFSLVLLLSPPAAPHQPHAIPSTTSAHSSTYRTGIIYTGI